MQQVRLSGSRAAAAYIDATNCALAGQHNRRPGQPAVAVRGVVADLKALDHQLILTDLSVRLVAMAATDAQVSVRRRSGCRQRSRQVWCCGSRLRDHSLCRADDIGAMIAIEVAD